jgi:carboxyl-terminal processing protease
MKLSNKLLISPSIMITGLFVVLSFIAFSQNQDARKNIQKMASVLQIIDYAYVDSVDLGELVDNTILSTLKELDPHSTYLSKEELDRTKERLEGSFDGIGISFQIFHDTILVISAISGGPSEKLGIMPGDKIIKIDGKKAYGEEIDNKFVMDHLRGKKGTTVDVSIYRKGNPELIDFTIVRDKIPVTSIDAHFMMTPDIGFIKLDRFQKTSKSEFHKSLGSLKEQGMKKLILDLRGNAGGFLGSAVDLADEFLSENKLIVYTEGLKSPRDDYKSTSIGLFEEGDLIILIDEGSASASEIVAGAVQDWDRGLIMGRRSFGKGLVQRPYPLIDGSMIRLTTARYYTPSGRCIQRAYDHGKEAYYKDLAERWDRGEMVSVDSIHFPDSLKYLTNNDRTVYGGGGIMPDIFVPYDSTWISDYYVDLRKKGVLNKFTLEYVDDNREELSEKYPDFKTYKDEFIPDDDFMQLFIDFGEKEGVTYVDEDYQVSKNVLTNQVKAWIARNLWDINESYQVYSEIDETLQEAVKILENGSKFVEMKINGD